VSAELLERATRALRETTESTPAALERVLRRIEHERPPAPFLSMRRVRVVAWTLAASLLGVGAWANATGRVHWFEPAPSPAPVHADDSTARSLPVHARAPRAAKAELPPQPAAEPAAELVPSLDAAPEARKPHAVPHGLTDGLSHALPPRKPTASPPTGSAPAAADADALYRAAHEAHFVQGDYAQAVAAWDRYLAAAEPGHRWTIEARYNRGIALYRLGQTERARQALTPFARGEYGSYRRAEASRLLEALPRSD
jgi:hypothetical protein